MECGAAGALIRSSLPCAIRKSSKVPVAKGVHGPVLMRIETIAAPHTSIRRRAICRSKRTSPLKSGNFGKQQALVTYAGSCCM